VETVAISRVHTVVATEEDGSEIQKVVIASVGGGGAGQCFFSLSRALLLRLASFAAVGGGNVISIDWLHHLHLGLFRVAAAHARV
jgi:hypothetical protein